MNRLISCALTTVITFTANAFTPPKAFITHNLTNTTTNAYVDEVAAPNPAMPNSTTKISWFIVKTGCQKHKADFCPAVIKMDIESDAPVEVGTLYLELESGIITPSKISANGYTVTVNAPGEITVTTEH